jgi:hypothetical protein
VIRRDFPRDSILAGPQAPERGIVAHREQGASLVERAVYAAINRRQDRIFDRWEWRRVLVE